MQSGFFVIKKWNSESLMFINRYRQYIADAHLTQSEMEELLFDLKDSIFMKLDDEFLKQFVANPTFTLFDVHITTLTTDQRYLFLAHYLKILGADQKLLDSEKYDLSALLKTLGLSKNTLEQTLVEIKKITAFDSQWDKLDPEDKYLSTFLSIEAASADRTFSKQESTNLTIYIQKLSQLELTEQQVYRILCVLLERLLHKYSIHTTCPDQAGQMLCMVYEKSDNPINDFFSAVSFALINYKQQNMQFTSRSEIAAVLGKYLGFDLEKQQIIQNVFSKIETESNDNLTDFFNMQNMVRDLLNQRLNSPDDSSFFKSPMPESIKPKVAQQETSLASSKPKDPQKLTRSEHSSALREKILSLIQDKNYSIQDRKEIELFSEKHNIHDGIIYSVTEKLKRVYPSAMSTPKDQYADKMTKLEHAVIDAMQDKSISRQELIVLENLQESLRISDNDLNKLLKIHRNS